MSRVGDSRERLELILGPPENAQEIPKDVRLRHALLKREKRHEWGWQGRGSRCPRQVAHGRLAHAEHPSDSRLSAHFGASCLDHISLGDRDVGELGCGQLSGNPERLHELHALVRLRQPSVANIAIDRSNRVDKIRYGPGGVVQSSFLEAVTRDSEHLDGVSKGRLCVLVADAGIAALEASRRDEQIVRSQTYVLDGRKLGQGSRGHFWGHRMPLTRKFSKVDHVGNGANLSLGKDNNVEQESIALLITRRS
jgi:hypothetical protein